MGYHGVADVTRYIDISTTLLAQLGQKLYAHANIPIDPTHDPETSESLIDFLQRILPRHSYFIFSQPPAVLEHIFMFILAAFRGRDQLPKLVAADFLSALLCLSDLPADQQQTVHSALEHLGPLVAGAVVFNISGNAARSELDKVCDPLRKLVVRHLQAKNWLQGALFSENFSSDRVKDNEKTAFLQKIIK